VLIMIGLEMSVMLATIKVEATHFSMEVNQTKHTHILKNSSGILLIYMIFFICHIGVPFDPEDLFREMFRDHPAFRGGMRGGGGGFPGGVQFSFNGVPMGGGAPMQPTQIKLPEPLQTILSFISKVIPTPFLVLGAVFLFMYVATAVIGLMLRNLFVVIALVSLPIPGQAKLMMWIAFFGAGIFGYL
jgi:hypothetical protein